MITIQAKVDETNTTIPIKVGAGEFKLILRPVSDTERLMDQGMSDRFFLADDPLEAARFHAARYLALLNVVIDWEGVVTPGENGADPVPVPFGREAMRRLFAVDGVASAVADALVGYFKHGGAGRREKGESEGLPLGSSLTENDSKGKLPGPSSSTPEGSEPGNLPNG